ncbi:hypothetical protein ABT336_22410 [Micromonospora sp. NPDC000207]|uniref:hypothetical protein n=1 Tax=Micromonospora sp. NPDC000207 TaxID=3154246 RepID=UPI0033340731
MQEAFRITIENSGNPRWRLTDPIALPNGIKIDVEAWMNRASERRIAIPPALVDQVRHLRDLVEDAGGTIRIATAKDREDAGAPGASVTIVPKHAVTFGKKISEDDISEGFRKAAERSAEANFALGKGIELDNGRIFYPKDWLCKASATSRPIPAQSVEDVRRFRDLVQTPDGTTRIATDEDRKAAVAAGATHPAAIVILPRHDHARWRFSEEQVLEGLQKAADQCKEKGFTLQTDITLSNGRTFNARVWLSNARSNSKEIPERLQQAVRTFRDLAQGADGTTRIATDEDRRTATTAAANMSAATPPSVIILPKLTAPNTQRLTVDEAHEGLQKFFARRHEEGFSMKTRITLDSGRTFAVSSWLDRTRNRGERIPEQLVEMVRQLRPTERDGDGWKIAATGRKADAGAGPSGLSVAAAAVATVGRTPTTGAPAPAEASNPSSPRGQGSPTSTSGARRGP